MLKDVPLPLLCRKFGDRKNLSFSILILYNSINVCTHSFETLPPVKVKDEDEDEDEYPLLHSLIRLVGHSNCKCRIAGHLHLYLHKSVPHKACAAVRGQKRDWTDVMT